MWRRASPLLLQAGLQPGPIRVTARADGLLPATATITSQPAEGATPRAPGVLPEPLPRPVPTRFTKLTGAVIGTPGAYQGEKADVTKAFDGDTSTGNTFTAPPVGAKPQSPISVRDV